MLASAEREIYARLVSPSAVFLVYVLPMLLVIGGCLLAWHRDDASRDRWIGSAEVGGLGLALLVGFCALEARWPWELHSPWRRHYWLPVGVVGIAVLGGLRTPMWYLLGVTLVGLWALLHKYAFQLHPDWTDLQHTMLFVGMLAWACVSFLGHWKLAERVPGNRLLIHLGVFVSAAALYAFFGASSAKVAQWMTIIGSALTGAFVLTLWRRGLPLQPAFVLLVSWFLVGGLYYGFYSGEESLLAPLLLLLAAPLSGLFGWKLPASRLPWIVTGWTILCVAAATASYFLTRATAEEEEDDYLDAYGFVMPQFDVPER